MDYNYKKETEDILSMVLILSNNLKDLICYTDKRTKSYKKMKEMVKYLREFEEFDFDSQKSFNRQKVFDIEVDIKFLENLQFLKTQSNQKTLSETLNYFINQFKNSFIKEYLINIDDLEDIITKNNNLINSIYTEKILKEYNSKILFSIDDIIIEKNKKYINLNNFYIINKDNKSLYVTDNITIKELKALYKIS